MKIKLNTIGKILNGEYQNWYILIEDDTGNTGGYLILIFNQLEINESRIGYDDWVEDYKALEEYLEETGWRIEWIYNEEQNKELNN